MQYDVIIVGGGPAGSLAGLTLANKGYQVLILDKTTFPRDKFCGGGLSRRILKRFPFLSKIFEEIPVHYINKVCLKSPNGMTVYEEREEPIYFIIRRSEFDTLLLKQCKKGGLDVLEGHKVTQLVDYPDAIAVITDIGKRFIGKLVIGADGVHSAIARHSGLNPGWPSDKIGINFMEETPYEQLHINMTNMIYVFYGFNYSTGYGYIFPKKNYVNIGIGFLYSYFKENIQEKPYAIYKHFFDFLTRNNFVNGQSQRSNFHGFFVPLGGPLKKTFAPRVLLCGDAAGFVNAFSAEGIYYAMVSAEHAAKVALQALAHNDFSEQSLSTYQANWQQEIGNELEVSVKIQQELFKRPHLINSIVKGAKNNSSLRRTLADYATGELEYRKLKKRILLNLTPVYLKYKLHKIFQRIRKAG